MATAVFEKAILPPKSENRSSNFSSNTRKSEKNDFNNLVREKSRTKSDSTGAKFERAHKISDVKEPKATLDTQQETSPELLQGASDQTEPQSQPLAPEEINPSATVLLQPKLTLGDVEEAALEEIATDAEDENPQTDSEIDEENILPFATTEQPNIELENNITINSAIQNTAQHSETTTESENIIPVNDNSSLTPKEIVDQTTSKEIPADLIIKKATPEEQALLQNMKSLELPQNASNNTLQTSNNKPSETGITSKLAELVANKADIKVENIDVKPSNNIMGKQNELQVASSANLLLADETKQGQKVLSKLNGSKLEAKTTPKQSVSNADFKLSPEAELTAEETLVDLDQNSSARSSFKSSTALQSNGGSMVARGDEFFASFRENAQIGGKQASAPVPTNQVSLAVNEAINASDATSGKKQITISLFPDTLGHVKVEIISAAGKDGASKIESIKIIAEKRETLEILEKSRIDLQKSLKEVTDSKEESSLEFEMNQGNDGNQKGDYFETLQERENWMNKFTNSNEEENDAPVAHAEQDVTTTDTGMTGYITEDSINIKV